MNTEQYKNIPLQLKELKQWVGHKKKKPISPHTGGGAKANDQTTWGTFKEAVEAVDAYSLDGIGFEFGNGICGVDIDHCVAEDGTLSDTAKEIIQAMNSYTEYSPSGTGIHILFTGNVEANADFYTNNREIGVEIYGKEHYFTVTGNVLGKLQPIQERTTEVKQIQLKYMRKAKKEAPKAPKPTVALSDEEVIRKASTAKNADEFKKLWSGDINGYDSQSEADLALCNKLAFYCGDNADQIDRIFRQSGLMRDKWDNHPQYANDTVQSAIKSCPATYNPNLGAYVEENGCVYRRTGQNEKKYLANFIAYPLEAVEKDNGNDKATYITVGGKGSNGVDFPPVTIPTEQFASMNWITKSWPIFYRIAPGANNKEYVRDYIQGQAADIQKKTIYTHTGFRVVNKKLCYLYHGGAIGQDGILCELEGDLHKYTFADPQGIDERTALQEVFNLFNMAPQEISYPLLAFTYLAPLNYFMEAYKIAPAFVLFCIGATQSFKTNTSMLYLSYFHTYSGMTEAPPTNFRSTANAIEKMAFILKDMPLLIDDYHPSTDKEKKYMDGLAQTISRAFGDHSSRGRMNSDTTLKQSFYPRGLGIVTGEDVPSVGQSGIARNYFVHFNYGDVDQIKLTERQNNAKLLNIAMQGYIKWLIANADEISTNIKVIYDKTLETLQTQSFSGRAGTTIACLLIGIYYFAEYAVSVGLLDVNSGKQFITNAETVFAKSSESQMKTQAEEKPTTIFLSTLNELLASKKKATEDTNGKADDAPSVDRRIGYHDEQYYYLFPDIAFNAVCDVLKGNGTSFPVSKNRLLDDLAKAGLIATQSGRNTVKKRILGSNMRFIFLVKSALDNETERRYNEQPTEK